jgi:tetratricopeptide (TPR) repeat protein
MSLESGRGLAPNVQVISSPPSILPSEHGRNHALAWRISFRVALVTFVAFAVILDNSFVEWDDMENFVQNLAYRGLGARQIIWAWTTFRLGVYQPLSWMLAEAEYAASGINPRGYHLTSVFLHTACAVVLYVLTFNLLSHCQLTGESRESCGNHRYIASGLATALFAVHPLRVEPVAWASGQAYLPCILFAMLSVLCYVRAHEANQRQASQSTVWWLATSIVLFGASLLSKAASLGLPAALLVLDFYPLRRLGSDARSGVRRSQKRVWLEKLPYIVLSLILGVLAIAAKRSTGTLADVERTGIMGRLALACYSAWFYLIKTLLPADLHAFPVRPEPLDWTRAPYVLSMLGVTVVSIALYRHRRVHPGYLAAWLAYLLLLAPASGLVTYGRQVIGDRYSYLAMIPGVVLVAGGICQWWAQAEPTIGRLSTRRAASLAIGLAWVTMLMVLTWRQCQTWADSGALWAHAIRHGGGENGDLHNNLGVWRARDGDIDAAVAELKLAVRLLPDRAEAHFNLANALAQNGESDAAIAALRLATWRWPDDVFIRKQLSKFMRQAGREADAADQDTTIARLSKRSVEPSPATTAAPTHRP